MTKEAGMLDPEMAPDLGDCFEIGASSFPRPSLFVLSHSYVDLAEKHECEFRRFQFCEAPIIRVA